MAEFRASQILKIDLSVTPVTVSTLISGLGTPGGLAISGDFLYVNDVNSDYIGKIDLTSSSPTLDIILPNVVASLAIEISGNYLYYSNIASRIWKVDITSSNPTPAIFSNTSEYRPLGIKAYEGYLYFGEYLGDKIWAVSLETGGIGTALASGVTDVVDAGVNESAIFIAQRDPGRITKITRPQMGVDESVTKNMVLYPNPANHFIQIDGLEKSVSATLYNDSGVKIKTVVIEAGKKMDISNLPSGVYILNLDNGRKFKFIKK